MQEKEKVEIKVTAEEQELVFKGIRPETMEYAVYRQVRKELQKAQKLYSGGQFKHISINLNPKMYNVESKGTYIRTEPRRHETLNRLWQRNGQNDSN